MKTKAKKCKGTGKASGHGCGNESVFRKYGLCISSCYPNWLYRSPEGRELLTRTAIKSKNKVDSEHAKKERDYWKKKKEDSKGFSDWMNDLQKIFNEFIRLRDAHLPCISCGTIANVKYDAGHFLSVGSYPNLRVVEINVNKQCSKNCNVEKRGNIHEYRDGMIKKYGLNAVRDLEANRQKTWKPPIYEIKNMITYYKAKVKELKK